MPIDKTLAAIDTDFFLAFTEDNKNTFLFLTVMDALNLSPVMHIYVYEQELGASGVAKELVRDGVVKIYDYHDFVDDANKEEYESSFKKAYNHFNYPFDSKSDCFTYHCAKQNLGEIRTTLMVWYLGINIFMSNDKAAKFFVENKLNNRRRSIEVYDIYITLKKLGELGSHLKWSMIKGFAKKKLHKNQDYNCLREKWVKNEQ